MRVLLDTNVLGRFSQPTHVQHRAALAAIRQLGALGHELRSVPQVLYEYWVVATRPVSVNGLGFSVADARQRVDEFVDLFLLLRDERGIFQPWLAIVDQCQCRGKLAHDARLVAAMKRHGLTHILTFNDSYFQRYQGIGILRPDVLPPSLYTAR